MKSAKILLIYATLAISVYSVLFLVLYLNSNPQAPNNSLIFHQGYQPQNSQQVILTLPSQWRRTKQLAETHNKTPQEIIKSAQNLIRYGKQLQDSRYISLAQSKLSSILASKVSKDVSFTAMYLQSDIYQYQHQFDRSIRLLTNILVAAPDHLNARLMRSNLYTIKGDYANALSDCKNLTGKIHPLILLACNTQNHSRSGKLKNSYSMLYKNMRRFNLKDPWIYSLLSDMAKRLNRKTEAQRLLDIGLYHFPENNMLQIAKINHLLLENNCKEINTHTSASNTIQFTLAKFHCNPSVAGEKRLRNYINKEVNVGNNEISDYRLLSSIYFFALKDQDRALEYAKQNWSSQKEPEDFSLSVKIALHYQDKNFIEELKSWKIRTQYQDNTIRL